MLNVGVSKQSVPMTLIKLGYLEKILPLQQFESSGMFELFSF